MSKFVFEVTQRYEITDGVIKMVSSKTQVLSGTPTLYDSAVKILKDFGFEDFFEQTETGTYLSYKVKGTGRDHGTDLILYPQKNALKISMKRQFLEKYCLDIEGHDEDERDESKIFYGHYKIKIWIFPGKVNAFHHNFKEKFCNSLAKLGKTDMITKELEDFFTSKNNTGSISLDRKIPESDQYSDGSDKKSHESFDDLDFSELSLIGSSLIPKRELKRILYLLGKTCLQLETNSAWKDKMLDVKVDKEDQLKDFLSFFAKELLKEVSP